MKEGEHNVPITVPPVLTTGIDEATAALAAGWSLPYAWMNDPQLNDFELDSIFGRSWQAVGLERDVDAPGDRIIGQAGRLPVVAVRGRDHELRAFANVCRHRGYPVVREDGCRRSLQCMYHAWTYDLDGRLLKAPGSNGTDFDESELELRPLGAQAWRGVVFVNGDIGCAPFEQVYPDLESSAEQHGFDLRRYAFHSRLVTDVMCNWKVFYDNIVECYHCPTMHRETFNTRYDDKSFMKCEWVGRMRIGLTEVKGVDPAGDPSHRTIQLFPGIVLLQDRVIGQVCRFAPTGPQTTRMIVDYLYNPQADRATVDEFVQLWTDTFAEDRAIVAVQQQAIVSGALERGRLLAEREESVPGVQALILDAYRRGVTPDMQAMPNRKEAQV